MHRHPVSSRTKGSSMHQQKHCIRKLLVTCNYNCKHCKASAAAGLRGLASLLLLGPHARPSSIRTSHNVQRQQAGTCNAIKVFRLLILHSVRHYVGVTGLHVDQQTNKHLDSVTQLAFSVFATSPGCRCTYRPRPPSALSMLCTTDKWHWLQLQILAVNVCTEAVTVSSMLTTMES